MKPTGDAKVTHTGKPIEALESSVPVAEVTVFEDRAQVMRRGLVQFPAGASSIVIDGVAPTLVDKTLAVQVLGPVSVTSVRIVREQPADGTAASEPTLLAAGELTARSFSETAERMVTYLERDIAHGVVDDERWLAAWKTIDAAVADAQLAPALKEQAEQPRVPQISIRVEFEASDAGPFPVQVDYVVPNATWRPHYRVELGVQEPGSHESQAHEPPHANVDVGAYVWQHTGEDWDDAVLCLSTQRISLGQKPPDLSPDYVSVGRRAATKADADGAQEPERKAEGAALMPDDYGRWIRFTAPNRATVASDGQGVRLTIERFAPETEIELLCGQDEARRAKRVVRFANESARPLLAGPVELIEGGGWCGRSTLAYSAAGEQCELPWRSDDEVRVRRKVHKAPVEARRMMSSRTRAPHRVEIKLSNLSAQSKSVKVREALPPDDGERTQVRHVPADSGDVVPDDDGTLQWDVELAPFSHREIAYEFVVESNQRTSVEA